MNIKMIICTVALLLISFAGIIIAGTGKYVHVIPDPNDPNIPGYWTYVYTYSDGVTITIKNPTSVIKWQYWIIDDPNYVFESIINPPFAERVSSTRFTVPHGQFKKYTHEQWLKEKIIKHWLDPNDISGGFTLHDLSQLAKHWDTKLISQPVYYKETSKIYHLESCKYATGEGLVCIDLKDAKAKGLKPCPTCNPYPEPSPATSPLIDPNSILKQLSALNTNDPNLLNKILIILGE